MNKKLFSLLMLLLPLLGMAQMIPNQSVEVEYDARGNRVVRKLWNPQTPGSKRGDDQPSVDANGSLAAWPNPASNELNVAFALADSAIAQVQLVNSMGQVLQQRIMAQGAPTTLDLTGLPAGIYQLIAFAADRPEQRNTLTIIHY